MDKLAADSCRADSPPPPPMPDDVLRQIFLRLPPEPIHLSRASSVCKHWRALVHDAGFLRRFREFHGGTPPFLGFFNLRHIIMPAEDGRLGLAGLEKFSLHLWSGIACIDDGVVTWAHHRVIDLEKFLAPEAVAGCTVPVSAVGYAEDADAIFVEVHSSGVYMIHLKSMRIEKVSEYATRAGYICPYASFYAPGINIGCGDDQPELLNST